MPGIGQPDVEPLSGGAAAQPLVSPMQPAVTPDAVKLLVDAVHNGAINTIDIANRIGAVAQAEKKANLEKLSEYVSPEAIQSRMSEINAAGQQAQLAGTQAQAQQPLVQPLAQNALQDIIKQNATINNADAVKAYTSLHPPIYKTDSNGNPTKEYDYDAMGREGSLLLQAFGMRDYAQSMLKGELVNFKDPVTGQQRAYVRNALGENVTPGPDNPTYQKYIKLQDEAFKRMWAKPDTSPHYDPSLNEQPTSSAGPSQPSVSVEPQLSPTEDSAIRARYGEYLVRQGVDPDAAFGMAARANDKTIQVFSQSQHAQQPVVAPATSAAPAVSVQPTIAPAAPQSQPLPSVFPSMATGPTADVWDKKDIVDELQKDKVYENWSQTRSQVGNFLAAANAINSMPKDANFNPQDIALAESLIKMYDPAGVIREFKWDKFEHNQPLLEKLKAYQNYALGKGSFAPSTRQDLINLGKETIAAREEGVRPVLELAQKRAATNPALSLDQILHPADLDTLKGNSLSSRVSPASADSGAPAGAVTIGGRTLVPLPNGMFRVVK